MEIKTKQNNLGRLKKVFLEVQEEKDLGGIIINGLKVTKQGTAAAQKAVFGFVAGNSHYKTYDTNNRRPIIRSSGHLTRTQHSSGLIIIQNTKTDMRESRK